MERGSGLVEMLPDVGVFTKISQELETEEDVLIPVRAFRVTLVLHALSVTGPGSTEPGGDLGVIQMSRKVESASRNSCDWYYRRQVRGNSPGSHVWLTRSRSCLEIGRRCRGCSTLDGTRSARRGTHSKIIVGLEGNDTILDSNFIEAMGRAVVDNNMGVGVDFERHPSSGGGGRIGDNTNCTSCMGRGLWRISCTFWRGICSITVHVDVSVILGFGFWP